jgi:O-antigen ligase
MIIFIAPFQIGNLSFYGDTRYLKIGLGILLALIGILTWLYEAYLKRTLCIVQSKLYLPMALFLLWSLASFFWAFNLHLAIITWVQFLSYGFIFFIVVNSFSSKKSIDILVQALITSLFVISIIGLFQHNFPDVNFFYDQYIPPAASFANKNLASHFVVMTIPLSLLMMFVAKSIRISFLYSLVTFLALWYVIIIAARQAYLAIGVELLVFILFLIFDYAKNGNSFMRHIQHIKIKIFTFIFLIFSLFIVSNFSSDGFDLDKGNKLTRLGQISLEGGSSRIPAWKNTIEMIKDHPIKGVGAGQWSENYPLYYDVSTPDVIFGDTTRLKKAHNEYLEMLANVGFVGFLPLIWIFIIVFNNTWSKLKSTDDRGLVLAFSLGILGFMVVAFFSFPIWAYVSAFILMVYIALISKLSNTLEKKYIVPINKKWYLLLTTIVLLFFSLASFYSYKLIVSEHYRILSISKYNQKDFESSNLYGVKSSELNPYNEEILNQAGFSFLNNSKAKEAVPYLIKANELTLFNSISLINLQAAYMKIGEIEKSKTVSRKILINDPRNVKALANLVRILYDQGEYEETTELYRQLKLSFEYFKDRSNFGPYHKIMSSLALKVNNPKYFSYIYDDLVKRRPTANNYAVYGFVEYKLGNKVKAKKMFLMAIEIDEKINILESIRKDLKL